MLRDLLARLLMRKGKASFLMTIPPGAMVLDVGCGNESPLHFKRMRPDIYYVGLDIADYNQTPGSLSRADEYICVPPERYAEKIGEFQARFDAVVSSHNLEHCLDQRAVLKAIAKSLNAGGRLYLSFPCEASVDFPHRKGTLNFYDDATHLLPPNFKEVLQTLEALGLQIDFATRRYRPFLLFLAGGVLESLRFLFKRVTTATWAYYGFESIIWATASKHGKADQR